MQPTFYQVGQPYVPGQRIWPEAQEYNFRGGEHEIRMFFKRLKAQEVLAISEGQIEFGLYVEDDLIFLLYRFGDLPWGDSSYSWHLVTPSERTMPEDLTGTGAHMLIHVVLVDADTGLIRALRVCTFSPEFSAALHTAIRAQITMPFDQDTYIQKIIQFGGLHPTTELVARAQVRCKGGE